MMPETATKPFDPAEWLPRIEALGYRYHVWRGSVWRLQPECRENWPEPNADIPIFSELETRDRAQGVRNRAALRAHLVAIGRELPDKAA